MDVIQEETLSPEPLDEILESMPNAGFGVLIAILQIVQEESVL